MLAVILGLSLLTGCTGKEGAAIPVDGNTVKVHYTGTLDDGTVFDSSRDREPLEFTIGEGSVITGFENAVKSLHVGETGTFTMPPEEAYGPRNDNLVLTLEKDKLPEGLNPTVGQQLQMQLTNGSITMAVITEVTETTITVDANHPLAGQNLTFEIELLEIR
jgi:peptidylprolyl isomerase